MIDLHTHTTVSDGSMTPTELLSHAVENGIEAIAVTDHDSISGVKEAIDAAVRFAEQSPEPLADDYKRYIFAGEEDKCHTTR
jgi:histidinol phosphatase-like PHP family hydrolase